MTAHITNPSASRRHRGPADRIALKLARGLRMLAQGLCGHASTSPAPAETRVTPAVWPNDPVKLQRRDTP